MNLNMKLNSTRIRMTDTRLAFWHIYKCGGLGIAHRYKHDPKFAYQRIWYEAVLNWDSQQKQVIPYTDIDKTDIRVIFGHGVSERHKNSNIEYHFATALRDPIQRIMSAYNFHRVEMYSHYNIDTKIDFDSWFLNRENILPTQCHWQWQHFSDDIDESKRIISEMNYLLFLDDSYTEKVDQLFAHYGLDNPNTLNTNMHGTRESMNKFGATYLTWDDLSDSSKQRVFDEIETEYEFYNYCLELKNEKQLLPSR